MQALFAPLTYGTRWERTLDLTRVMVNFLRSTDIVSDGAIILEKIFDKLSSYNLLNYLIPGVIFGLLFDELSFIELPSDQIFILIVYFYFFGLVASRIGSIVLEPLLEMIGFLPGKDYPKYLAACDKDTKIDVLVEQANSYRTVLGGMVLLLFSYGLDALANSMGLTAGARTTWLVVFGVALFGFAFRKQSKYVSDRIENRTK